MTTKDSAEGLLREAIAEMIKRAWKRYEKGFGEPPHGTDGQIAAMAQLIPLELLDAFLSQSGEGWMPIETAPKDGTDVLIWCAPWSCGSEARYIDGEGWWLANNDPSDHWGDQQYPTHWQPLPLPPPEK